MNPSSKYPWTRFWCPRGKPIVADGAGYLLDPESPDGRLLLPHMVPFEKIEHVPCLILLGEPGLGKSTTIAEHQEAARKNLAPGELLLTVDFRYDREPDESIFNTPEFSGWLKGSHSLQLFIDSLDECPHRDVAQQLYGKIRRGPISALKLRIACRTAELPQVINHEVVSLWSKAPAREERHGFFELAPLRLKDVELAAGKAASAFLAEVSGKGAAALAGRPITLGLLLDLYSRDGSLPRTRWEVYEHGCRHLCEELSGTRRDSGQQGTLDSDERLAIASRIGAVCTLGQRPILQIAPVVPGAPDRTVGVRDLVGGQERFSRREVTVSKEAVYEVLLTALFTGHGSPHELGWAHQTYAEFLAARFLHSRALSIDDLGGVLLVPNQGGRVTPSLREVAAWLASKDPSLRDHLLLVDPQVLLRSDSAIVGDVEREQLVEALLARAHALELPDHAFKASTDYRKLAHRDLARQLAPWIRDRHRHLVARRMAIEIAGACRILMLDDVLVETALDGGEEHALRIAAARAIVNIGSDKAKQRLRPLVNSNATEDPDDELRGYGLSALWPVYTSAGDLFKLLKPPRQQRFMGRYQAFLMYELNEGLSDSDLPMALAWAASIRGSSPSMDPLVHTANTIIRRAAGHLQRPDILKGLVLVARTRFEAYEPLFPKTHDLLGREDSPDPMEAIRADSTMRRRFVEAFVSFTSPMNHEYFGLAEYGLLDSSDLKWLIDNAQGASDPEKRTRWLDIVSDLVQRHELTVEITEALIDAVENNPNLRRALAWWYEPVETSSPVAEELRLQHRRLLETLAKIKRNQTPKPPLDPPPEESVKDILERFEAGEMGWFEHLQLEMTLEATSTHYNPGWGPDLTGLRGWAAADDATRSRIVEASKRFIREAVPRSPASLAEQSIPFSSVAEYRPFYLLMRLDPAWLDSLPVSVWQRFSPVIIAYHFTGGDRAIHSSLVERAYHYAPAEMLWALGILLDKENAQHGAPFVLRTVAHCWDDRLSDLLILKAQDPALKPTFLSALLGDLLDHDVAAGRQLAVSCCQLPIPSEAGARARALAAGEALLKHSLATAWKDLWPVLDNAPEFGRELFLQAAEHFYRDAHTWGSDLPEQSLADLYIWLGRVFPTNEDVDPITKKSAIVTARETVGEMRRALLRSLSIRGTSEALGAIEAVRQAFPEDTGLAFTRIVAVESSLQAAWVPLRPDQVIDLQPAPKAPLSPHVAPPSEVGRAHETRKESMKLSGEQAKALREALLDAFPTQDELRVMLREETSTSLDAIALGGSLSIVVSKVIADAEARGWMGALVDGARKANPNNSTLVNVARGILANRVTAESSANLERIVRARSPFVRLEEFLDFLEASKRRVCRVETRGGHPLGTAFLVGPDVVLTNHHVVTTNLGADSPDLQLRFDYLTGTDGAPATTGRIYQFVRRDKSNGRDWLLAAGPPSPGDLKDDGSAPQSGELDFALLRIDGAPGREQVDGNARGWVDLPATPAEAQPDDVIAILQHAAGDPLRIAIDTISSINVGRTRVRYHATTLGGASGSPCFTLTRQLVALHHGGIEGRYNQGIPMTALRAWFDEKGFDKLLGGASPSPGTPPAG